MELNYQPVVNAKTNMVTGVKALIRWNHPERGAISPSIFVPIAEEANLIWPIGEWVLRRACEEAARWPSKLRVAVNVSPIQFANEELPKIVANALARSEEHTSELQSLMRISYAVFCLKKKKTKQKNRTPHESNAHIQHNKTPA